MESFIYHGTSLAFLTVFCYLSWVYIRKHMARDFYDSMADAPKQIQAEYDEWLKAQADYGQFPEMENEWLEAQTHEK